VIVNTWIVRAVLLVIAVAVTVHVLSLSTLAKGKGTTSSGALPEEKSQ
jgi:NhaP-type Na+/H+ or K+/H+ antiporter